MHGTDQPRCWVLSKIENDIVVPGNVVWIIISDRLWRCAPQQLRRASEREHAQHLLLQPKPWTFENITRTIAIGQYRDVSNEEFPEEQNPEEGDVEEQIVEDMQDAPEGVPDNRPRRQRSETAEEENPPKRTLGNGRRYPAKGPPGSNLETAVHLAEECGAYVASAFFSKEMCPDKVVEIEFPFIEGDRHLRKYLKNPEAFVVSSLKKKRVEIREKDLDATEKELIREAKGKEIREFIKEHVVERVKEHEKISKDRIMRMRWVLTWKKQEDGSKRKSTFGGAGI